MKSEADLCEKAVDKGPGQSLGAAQLSCYLFLSLQVQNNV